MFAEYLLMECHRWLYLSHDTVDLKRMSNIDGDALLKRRGSQLISMPTGQCISVFSIQGQTLLNICMIVVKQNICVTLCRLHFVVGLPNCDTASY